MSQSSYTSPWPPSAPTYGPQWLVNLSWLFWVVAILFALAGMYFLWRSLLRDPDRRKRRCPKCWYDMSGATGLRCPECGRGYDSEKKLHKRRRKPLQALAAIAILFIALSVALIPCVMHRGWIGSIPTTAVIVASWVYDTDDLSILGEARNRGFAKLSGAEKWMLRRTARSILHRQTTIVMPLQTAEDYQRFRLKQHQLKEADSLLRSLRTEGAEIRDVLMDALKHSDPDVRCVALGMIDTLASADRQEQVVSAVRPLLASAHSTEFQLAAQWLVRVIQDPSDTDAIAQGLEKHPPHIGDLANYGVAGVDRLSALLDDPAVSARAAQELHRCRANERAVRKVHSTVTACPDQHGRMWCASLLGKWRVSDPTVHQTLMTIARSDPSDELRHSALTALSEIGLRASELVPALIAGLADSSPAVRYFCAWRIASTVPAGFAAIPALNAMANDPTQEERTRQAAAHSLDVLTKARSDSSSSGTAPAQPAPSP